jgi:hypothetical protein
MLMKAAKRKRADEKSGPGRKEGSDPHVGLDVVLHNQGEVNGGHPILTSPIDGQNVRHPLLGIATFDNESMLRFSIEGPLLAISRDEIRLSKDGSHALFMAFKQVPEIPQFTMPQQAVVLKLAAPGCKS